MSTQLTALQTAMMAAYEEMTGTTQIDLGPEDRPKSVRVGDLTDKQIAALFRYGKRLINDKWNSDKGKKDCKPFNEWFKETMAALGVTIGTGTGRGAPALSYEAKAERAILTGFFRDAGQKAETAKENAAKPDAWEQVTRIYIIRELSKTHTPEQVKAANLQQLVKDNIAAVKAAYQDDIKEKAAKLKAADAGTTEKFKSLAGLKL
jgi:hypothetical protein